MDDMENDSQLIPDNRKPVKKGILLGIVLLSLITIPLIAYFVSKPDQLQDIRSKAQTLYPPPGCDFCAQESITCPMGAGSCPGPGWPVNYTKCCLNGTPTLTPTPSRTPSPTPHFYYCTMNDNHDCISSAYRCVIELGGVLSEAFCSEPGYVCCDFNPRLTPTPLSGCDYCLLDCGDINGVHNPAGDQFCPGSTMCCIQGPTPTLFAPTPTPQNLCGDGYFNCSVVTVDDCGENPACSPAEVYQYTMCYTPFGSYQKCWEGCVYDGTCVSISPTITPLIGETHCYWVPEDVCAGQGCSCTQQEVAVMYCDGGEGPVYYASRCEDLGYNCCIGPSNTPKPPPESSPTPTPTVLPCEDLLIYKDNGSGTYVDITNQLLNNTIFVGAGEVIRIAVVPPATADAARVRVSVDGVMSAWTETTTKTALGEFYVDYTVPSYGQFIIEAETRSAGVWK